MKNIKSISLFLVLMLFFGAFLFAQQKEKDRVAYEKAREFYEKAKQYVYSKEYEKAIEMLNEVTEKYQKSDYLDDSLYWLAYSKYKLAIPLNLELQLKIQQQAIEDLNLLIDEYSQSTWADDAKILRIDLAKDLYTKGLSEYKDYINDVIVDVVVDLEPGHITIVSDMEKVEKVDPETELKLVALNALLNMDEEEAFPILEKIIKEKKNPKLRERALLVLYQSKHPGVLPLLVELATKDPDEKVKERAILWLGMRKEEEAIDALIKAYDTTNDTKLKERIVLSISQNKSRKVLNKLMDIA